MNRNNNFIAVKTRENARDYACRKSATAGLRVGALLSQICDCRAQKVNLVVECIKEPKYLSLDKRQPIPHVHE